MTPHKSNGDTLHWYKDAIIYELHIKAFRDGNGDGVGDFEGLLEKLDYLEDLGVSAIWVLPFYPSPLRDDGYDIADYYSINPAYGDIDQFKRFLDEAHKRGLKVITELVINHTSDQHPWFQRARFAPPGSPERNYYVWTNNPDQYKDVRIIFQDFEGSNWTWDPVAEQYYWHRFFHHQPDLNYDNPLVQKEIFGIIDYWCSMGVDGFRLDAVPYLFEREDTNGENLPETHAFLKELRSYVDEKFPGTLFLAEANMWPEDAASYFGDGDECHMNYHFPVMPRMFMALQMEDRYPITDIFDQTPPIPDNCQWAIFLRNHDELTLEMVTDEERDYMYKAYAKDPKARINLGIRHRLAPLMDNNRRKIELLNALLFSLPGTPVIYYGDEIGMGDNFYLGDRNGVRTPMQWSQDRNAGFSESNPQQLYLPLILDPEYHYESVNVETQQRNTSSLYWFMKRMISMRKNYEAFGRGDLTFVPADNAKVLSFIRRYKGETLLIVVNLSKFAQVTEVALEGYKGYVPVELMSKSKFPAIGEASTYFFTLGPYAWLWFSLEKTGAALLPDAPAEYIPVASWEALMSADMRPVLENDVLLRYITNSYWFIGKYRTIYSIEIKHHFSVPMSVYEGTILLVEVSYESGVPDLFQVAICFLRDEQARKQTESCPQSIIAYMEIAGEQGILCDAFYVTEFQRLLINNLIAKESIKKPHDELKFHLVQSLEPLLPDAEVIYPKLHNGDKYNTSLTYNNTLFLKLYRKVDYTMHPDVELTRFLEEEARFPYQPGFNGTIEWKTTEGIATLGMLQPMVENHGNGYTYMLDRLYNYVERVMARKHELPGLEIAGSITDPVTYEELPEALRELIGARTADQVKLMGIRTGEMHLALASGTGADFKPEPFSLHYQRSLFASMLSLVRECFRHLRSKLSTLPAEAAEEGKVLLDKQQEVLQKLKRIYAKKLDTIKTRVHGHYTLREILVTGKDLSIQGFGGNPYRAFSERRLKRSPVMDVANMLRSLHNVAYEGTFLSNLIPRENMEAFTPYTRLWAFYVSGFFLKGYLDTVATNFFLPKDKADFLVMLETYLLEKSLLDLRYELDKRPEMVLVPIKTILEIIAV